MHRENPHWQWKKSAKRINLLCTKLKPEIKVRLHLTAKTPCGSSRFSSSGNLGEEWRWRRSHLAVQGLSFASGTKVHKAVGVSHGFRAAANSLCGIRATHLGAQSVKRPEFIRRLHRELETMLHGWGRCRPLGQIVPIAFLSCRVQLQLISAPPSTRVPREEQPLGMAADKAPQSSSRSCRI